MKDDGSISKRELSKIRQKLMMYIKDKADEKNYNIGLYFRNRSEYGCFFISKVTNRAVIVNISHEFIDQFYKTNFDKIINNLKDEIIPKSGQNPKLVFVQKYELIKQEVMKEESKRKGIALNDLCVILGSMDNPEKQHSTAPTYDDMRFESDEIRDLSDNFTKMLSKYDERRISINSLTEVYYKNELQDGLDFKESSITQDEYEPGTEENYYEEQYECSLDLNEIIDKINESRFFYSEDIIRDLYLNLMCLDDKHFVILSGISGTGKSKLCKLFVNAVYGLDYDHKNPYLRVIQVEPGWTDSTYLFGNYSSISKDYIKTEFLDFVMHAINEKEKPHFVILDEMNLSRVEYYLSRYLSAVESNSEIYLHQNKDINSKYVPQSITIPKNLFIMGTVNIDETTNYISDKVLDRAFVMTLADVDLDRYWNKLDKNIRTEFEYEFNILKNLHDILKEYQMHFGYRVINEIIMKLIKNSKLPTEFQMNRSKLFDITISEKILPKIKGTDSISNLFDKLINYCEEDNSNYSETLRHLKRMKNEVNISGATSFWQ